MCKVEKIPNTNNVLVDGTEITPQDIMNSIEAAEITHDNEYLRLLQDHFPEFFATNNYSLD